MNLSTLASLHAPNYVSGMRGMRGLGATNLALNRPAGQSTTFNNLTVASKAVDGNTSGDGEAFIAATGLENQPWWQVDLGSIQDISDIRLWNRTDRLGDRLQNFYVLVSSDPMTSGDLGVTKSQTGVTPYYIPGPVGQNVTIGINRPGRYIRVQLGGRDYLQLAEVEVFAKEIPVTQASQTGSTDSSGSSDSSVTDTSASLLDSITNVFSNLSTAPGQTIQPGNILAPSQASATGSSSGILSKKFQVFGFQIPYVVPIGLVGLYLLSKKR